MTTALLAAEIASDPSMAENRCLVCDGPYGSSSLPGLKQCTVCSFITAEMDMSETQLASLYGTDYFHGDEYRDYVSEEASLKANFRNRIETLKSIIPDLARRRLLEIGCAYGFFLDEVKGDVAEARGIDISADATAFARSVRQVSAVTGSYLEYVSEPDIGIITMWDTVEHLPHPDLFFEKAAKDILPGGYIALTTGDIGSLNARLRGRRWRMIHPPTHLHYFSVDTLSKLLDRHGFDVIYVRHPGNSRNLRSILFFVLELRLGWSRLYRMMAKWRVLDWSLSLNLYDIMFVVGRRRTA